MVTKSSHSHRMTKSSKEQCDNPKPIYCATCVSGEREPSTTIEECQNMFCVGKIMGKDASAKLMAELNKTRNLRQF